MINHTSIFLLTMIGLLACANNNAGENEKKSADTTIVRTKPPSSFNDTMIIQSRAAVFYQPDSMQKEKIKLVTEPGIFNSNMHEYFYQMRNAKMVIEKNFPGVKILDVVNARYLLFSGVKGELIDLNNYNDACGLFLFDPAKPPRLADMMNIDTELPSYFNKN